MNLIECFGNLLPPANATHYTGTILPERNFWVFALESFTQYPREFLPVGASIGDEYARGDFERILSKGHGLPLHHLVSSRATCRWD